MRPGDVKERNLSWQDYSYPAELSNDGETLLFDEEGEAGGYNFAVYIRKTDGSPAVKLGPALAVTLSPDQKWVVSQTTTAPSQLVLLPTGAGDAKPLTHDALTHNWAHWMPDGQHILFAGNESGKANRFYLMGLDGQPPKAISSEGVDALQFAISIDGKEIAGIGPDASGLLVSDRRRRSATDPRIPARRGADRVDQRRKGAVRHETGRASREDHAHRHDDRTAHAMERADAAR